MPSADCCGTVREALASLSHFPSHATSQGIPQLSRGKSQSRPRINAGFTKHSLSGWRTWWSRAPSSQDCHASSPVRIPRPAHSFHASFRPRLTATPLRFPGPSAPRIPGQGTFTPKHDSMHGTHAAAKPCPAGASVLSSWFSRRVAAGRSSRLSCRVLPDAQRPGESG